MLTPNNLVTKSAPPVSAQAIISLGQRHGWDFHFLGVHAPPRTVVVQSGWRYVPILQESGSLPRETLERVLALQAAGMRVKTFVIAHEIPQRLSAPAGPPLSEKLKPWALKMARHSSQALRFSGHLLVKYGPPALEATAKAAGVLLIGAVLVMAMGLGAADPALIAITEDDAWIQVYAWMDESQ